MKEPGVETVLIAGGWTFLAIALFFDVTSYLTRPGAWWGPVMTFYCALLYGPLFLLGYGWRILQWWRSRE